MQHTFCGSCGSPLAAAARFCGICGAVTAATTDEPVGAESSDVAAFTAPPPTTTPTPPPPPPVVAAAALSSWEPTEDLALTPLAPSHDQFEPEPQRSRTLLAVSAACALLLVVAVVAFAALTGGDDSGDLALDPLATVAADDDQEDQINDGGANDSLDPVRTTASSIATVPPVGTSATDTTLATVVVPLPSTTLSAPPTTPATTAAPMATSTPVTTAPPSPPNVPGDLGIAGHLMIKPPCDGGYITVVGNAIDPTSYVQTISDLLARYLNSMYLRTDQTCPSLRADVDGNAIYTVYFGPYADSQTACAQRVLGPEDAYVRRLSLTDPPTHVIDCA